MPLRVLVVGIVTGFFPLPSVRVHQEDGKPLAMQDDDTFAPRPGAKSTWTHVKISGTKVNNESGVQVGRRAVRRG